MGMQVLNRPFCPYVEGTAKQAGIMKNSAYKSNDHVCDAINFINSTWNQSKTVSMY